MNSVKVKDMTFSDAYIQIFNLLDDCVFVIDIEGKIVLYNKASEKLDEMSKDDVLEKRFQDCFKIDKQKSSTLRTLISQEAHINVYQDYVTKLGKRISSVSSSYPLIQNEKMVGVLTITKDITKHKEMLNIFQKNNAKEGKEDKGIINFKFNDIIGENIDLKKNINIAKMASKTNTNILIYGETGTGKELFAQSIHNESNSPGNFVSLNCAAIPENLLESMLFGTSKGAFTGAIDQIGLFEEANNGTLFLDELNSMSLNLQSKLLRVIETGKIRRVGEIKERVINTKVLSAINIHPLKAIDDNLIRRDLFYRLGSIVINIPPLRDRPEDIKLLVKKFIEQYNKIFSKNVSGISKKVEEIFYNYSWPGNVRELEHSIEHSMIIMNDENLIKKNHIPTFIIDSYENIQKENSEDKKILEKVTNNLKSTDIKTILENVEEKIIHKALKKNNGNVAQTAKELGINRQTLDYRIKKFNIR